MSSVLSPTPPFSHAPRLRLAATVVPILVATTVIPAALFVKGGTFAVGFAMFGQPLITRGIHWLNANYPNWLELLELRRCVIRNLWLRYELIFNAKNTAEECPHERTTYTHFVAHRRICPHPAPPAAVQQPHHGRARDPP